MRKKLAIFLKKKHENTWIQAYNTIVFSRSSTEPGLKLWSYMMDTWNDGVLMKRFTALGKFVNITRLLSSHLYNSVLYDIPNMHLIFTTKKYYISRLFYLLH